MASDLDKTFAALSDPTRRAILARLASGEATVNELAEPFEITQPSISKHLKVLERAGLITRSRAAQTRPCRLEAAPLKEIANWVELYRNLWEQRFDRLGAYLESTKSTPTKGKRNGRKR
jgi:DNA-binding transcriptional ArsR family regulator